MKEPGRSGEGGGWHSTRMYEIRGTFERRRHLSGSFVCKVQQRLLKRRPIAASAFILIQDSTAPPAASSPEMAEYTIHRQDFFLAAAIYVDKKLSQRLSTQIHP